MKTQHLSFRYRAFLSKAQKEIVFQTMRFLNSLRNSSLEERISAYKKQGRSIKYSEQSSQLPAIKKLFPEIKGKVYSQSCQEVLSNIEDAFKGFFKSGKGFPRFKSIKRFKSICFPQGTLTGAKGAQFDENGNFNIFGLGTVDIVIHRPMEGKICKVILKKERNEYYVIFVCEVECPEFQITPGIRIVGVDAGLVRHMTMDDGTTFRHRKPYKTSKEKLAFLQRKLAKKTKGSNNYKKVSRKISNLHRDIANKRDDDQHKQTLKMLSLADVFCIEKLEVQKMLMSNAQSASPQAKNENISEAAWSSHAQKLKYKAERAGKLVIEVDPKNTSKTCSCCGSIKDNMDTKCRIYSCDFCGAEIDRDINAALNIRWRGILQCWNDHGINLLMT